MSQEHLWQGQQPQNDVQSAAAVMEGVLYEVKKIVVGQDTFLERILIAMLARGHLLIEGVPGLAKTLTVNTLAQVVQGSSNAFNSPLTCYRPIWLAPGSTTKRPANLALRLALSLPICCLQTRSTGHPPKYKARY